MQNLSLKYYPNAILTQMCLPCELPQDELEQVTKDMVKIMHDNRGQGLSAPQVGLGIRLFVMRDSLIANQSIVLVNPKIVNRSDNEVEEEEGCLSLPNIRVKVYRSTKIDVKYTSLDGKDMDWMAVDRDARVIQHEVDHLDGMLILDQVSKLQRRLLIDKYFKRSKQYATIRG